MVIFRRKDGVCLNLQGVKENLSHQDQPQISILKAEKDMLGARCGRMNLAVGEIVQKISNVVPAPLHREILTISTLVCFTTCIIFFKMGFYFCAALQSTLAFQLTANYFSC